MSAVEAVGYLASALVLTTFYMKTMMPLRVCAIASNVAFIAYGFFGEIQPVLVLHLVLLPLNVKRLSRLGAGAGARGSDRGRIAATGDVPRRRRQRPGGSARQPRRGCAPRLRATAPQAP
jgi:hypothetical protein